MLSTGIVSGDNGSGRLWGGSILQRGSVEAVEVYFVVPAAVGTFTVERRVAW